MRKSAKTIAKHQREIRARAYLGKWTCFLVDLKRTLLKYQNTPMVRLSLVIALVVAFMHLLKSWAGK